ncbi:LLM class flavin-dependent oxidoreductase [Actinoplanes friuliensis]|uniref:Luciferase-like monooxygenase n=1 Tax=Actinoplanes friuliensis DSM 7358 TaxID=1246995 RepID=U5W4C0_9ACTN|nr:LLM class flavin-dependent oxidoreductase [Actinoplanes friuliensis]AGZ43867.1 luciferase-like monooxygenase [Actinoplanes friuliensis DSM 7358]
MNLGVMLPRDLPPEQVLPYARRAEEAGFAELWVVEDLGFRGGIAQAAAVLAATTSIHVGIGVLPVGARNVAFAAMECTSLAELFPGRVTIGVGHGMPDWMRSVGAWPASPLRALEDYVRTLRDHLRGEAGPAVVPDVLTGVRGPKSLKVSGAVADGTVLAEPVTPEYVRWALDRIAAERPHRIVAYNACAVDEDENRALATVRPALAWIGEPDWAPHLAPLPFAAEFAALRARCASREEFTDRLPAGWVRQLSIVGTPGQARTRLDELAAAGVTTSVLIPAAADPLAALEGLAVR